MAQSLSRLAVAINQIPSLTFSRNSIVSKTTLTGPSGLPFQCKDGQCTTVQEVIFVLFFSLKTLKTVLPDTKRQQKLFDYFINYMIQ